MPDPEPTLTVADRRRQRALHLASRVPWALWTPIVALASIAMALRPVAGVRHWQRNVALLTGAQPSRWSTARAVWSWARNSVESLHLGQWSRTRINRFAVLSAADEQRLRSLAREPGAVIGLPHMGSWDLAGAWACGVDMPVSTVAEQLLAPEFALFKRVREDLGFIVHGHRQAGVTRALVEESRQGRLVCLLADRDFSRRGVPVVWPTLNAAGQAGGVPATMPPGPAHVALEAGAVLLGIACHYEGRRMRLVVSEPLQPPDHLADPRGRDRDTAAAAMTQQLCDFFASQIRAHPHDWHMLRPFFPAAAQAAAS